MLADRRGSAWPWTIFVHFTGYPEDKLLRLSGMQEVKSSFMMSLKEANHLKHGDGQKVMSLSRQDQDNLWLTILGGDSALSTFWAASEQLLTPIDVMKSVAVRVFRPGSVVFAQLPHKPLRDDGTPATLGDVLTAHKVPDNCEAVVQGVVMPLDAHVWDLQATASHGDGWIYVIVREKK